MATVKVKILRGVSLGAGVDVYPGDVVEVEGHIARQLVHRGSAELATAPPARVQTQEPVIENREDAPAHTGSRRARR